MGIRRLLNQNPALTTAISILLLMVALGVIGYELWPRGRSRGPDPEQLHRENQAHAAHGECGGLEATDVVPAAQ